MQKTIYNIFNTSANIQNKDIDSKLFSDEKIELIKDNICNDKVLHLNYSAHNALLHQSEDIIGIVKASVINQFPAVDSEDNQYKIKKLIRKHCKERKIQYWMK